MQIRNPPPRRMMLSTLDVAQREGVTTAKVALWCRTGAIWPVLRLAGGWAIDPMYVAAQLKRKPGRPLSAVPKKPSIRGRGRPKGVKNSKPYPKGVKRPRKNND